MIKRKKNHISHDFSYDTRVFYDNIKYVASVGKHRGTRKDPKINQDMPRLLVKKDGTAKCLVILERLFL